MTDPTPTPAPPLEPRGCPLPGDCSCPTAPIVPPELIRALEVAVEALTEPGLELGLRAIHQVTYIRRALLVWRDHASTPALEERLEQSSPPPQGSWMDEAFPLPPPDVMEAINRQLDRDIAAEVARRARIRGAAGPAADEGDRAQALEERFEQWWYDEGSVPPSEGRDWEEHVHHMTRIAWHNGAFIAAGPAADEGEGQ